MDQPRNDESVDGGLLEATGAPRAASPPTPWLHQTACGLLVVGIGATAYFFRDTIGVRGQAACGLACFLGIAIALSANCRAINRKTVVWGLALQVLFAVFILKVELFGVRPGLFVFQVLAESIKTFLGFSEVGANFVFGTLADPVQMKRVFPKSGVIFAFAALPTIVFVSAFFTLLHHLGILPVLVTYAARFMKYAMQTSGAETLAAVENVFMGQSEAPLIVQPYISIMTRSEFLALMTGGMATLSGGLIAVYIEMGADPVALLAGGVMSAPCSLYLAKILLPETEVSATSAEAKPFTGRRYANFLDAIATGASNGMQLAINIVAMLIAFLAFLKLIDYSLQVLIPSLSLQKVFSHAFSPLAFLIGLSGDDAREVADLLGTKLVANEFVAYLRLTGESRRILSDRAFMLATFALAGFANFGSIGIQLGAIGGMAEARRRDIAALGWRALLGGFLATLINASIAGMLL
ncbi:MAG TPA: nucleoside transporter C-terminal domain-containing protein [Pirellulales bacterium]|nr:nucleoside transporter C-terminal domain-containing protein [Pirellulales bacterium]